MTRIVLAAFAALVLGMLFVLADSVRKPLVRLIRAVLLGIVTIMGLIGLGVGLTGLQDGSWALAVVGGVIALLALRFGWALSRGGRRQRRHWTPEAPNPDHVPLTRAEPDSPWERFEAGLDWVARKQVRRSRAAIDGFVAERASPSLTHDQRGLLLSCEKRVPELIETCVERCSNASPRERDRYIDETLARITQIGDEAEQARRAVREADDRRLQVLHRYFDDVAPGEDRRPPL
jgi:hypothetical protein